MIEDIFKISVYKKQLDCNIPQLTDFSLWCKKNETGREVSNLGGYQSNDLDLSIEVIKPLVDNINIHSKLYANQLGLLTNRKLVINSMWVNINGYKDFNRPHAHPESILSGVFYIQTPSNCGDIRFITNEIAEAYWSPKNFKDFTIHTAMNWFVEAKSNELLIFPSWLQHMVNPNQNKIEKRISISFNVWYE